MTDDLIPVPAAVRSLPAPRDITTALREELNARVSAERASRGEVHQPEDVSPLVRALAGAHDLLSEYGRAFTLAANTAKEVLDEELTEAVGEQDGIPLADLKVEDLDGTDIHLTRKTATGYEFNLDSLISLVANDAVHVTRHSDPPWPDGMSEEEYRTQYEEWLVNVLVLTVEAVLSLGTFSPQVTKVRAYATESASRGDDSSAAVARNAIRKKAEKFSGIAYTRKERKQR